MTVKLNSQNLLHYLMDAAICNNNDLANIRIDVKYSNSFNWVINFPTGGNLVVKEKSCYHRYHTNNLICNERHIYEFLQSCPDLVYASSLAPEIPHFDDDNSIIIYKYPTDYIILERYYENNTAFPTAIAKLIGTTLAKLHLETMNSQECYNFMTAFKEEEIRYQLRYHDYLLDRIEPETLSKFPAEGLRFFAFYQRYKNLSKAVTELVVHHRHCCLTHNNPQLNKILIPSQWERLISKTEYSNKSLIKLIDWEGCSWGDPACDLGTAIAGYLLVWLNSITVHPDIELEKSLQLATIPLEVMHPSVLAMTRAYISTYPKVLEDSPDFLKRVIQFAGLALIYQILAMIQEHKGFNNQGICMLQVAKNLLCQPDKSFISVFGLTELSLVDPILYSVN